MTEAQTETVAKSSKDVEVVKMSDGREVEFVGKRKLLKEQIVDDNTAKVRFDFRNGETRLFVVPQNDVLRYAAHGASQKVGDETAGENDIDDMVLAVDDLIDRLNRGEWTVKREGGGMSGTSVLMKALMEYSGKSAEQIKAFLSGKTQAEKMALRVSDRLKAIVDRLESEKVAKVSKVNTGELLDALEAI